jgi:hypothetical protein
MRLISKPRDNRKPDTAAGVLIQGSRRQLVSSAIDRALSYTAVNAATDSSQQALQRAVSVYRG